VIENTLILWGMGLLGAALLLLVLEVFVPSGGIIGVTAVVCAIAGVVSFWRVSTTWGLTSLLVVLVLAPIAFNFALRIMPHTPVGRKLILSSDEDAARRQAEAEQRRTEQEQALVGAHGRALTDLRPIGAAEIDGTRVEVTAEGGPIDAGTAVRVTSVQGSTIRVRPLA
jgi:membrane-bound ClpP family serine protease